MKFHPDIKVMGDTTFRGDCPTETAEQVTFFAQLNIRVPKLAKIALHIRNEGARTWHQAARHKSEGMNTGASDIIIPCCPPIVIEMKRMDHTKSRITKEQEQYLIDCQEAGALVCVALGYEAALIFITKQGY